MSFSEYSAGAWTTADLLADIRFKARLSDDDEDYSDAVLMRKATDAILLRPAQIHAAARDGRTLSESSRNVSSHAVGVGRTDFVVPPWAFGGNLSSVFWRQNEADGYGKEKELSFVSLDRSEEASGLGDGGGVPWAFGFINDRIRVFPSPPSGGYLRILYPRRHGQLVALGSVLDVSLVAPGAGGRAVFTVPAVPSAWLINHWVDVYDGNVPHTLELCDMAIYDKTATTVTVDLSYDRVVSMMSGQDPKLTLSGQTAHVSLPLEFRGSLTSLVAAECLRNMGFLQDAADREQEAFGGLGIARDIITPRTKGVREKIRNPNSLARSFMRGGR